MALKEQISSKSSEDLRAMLLKPVDWSEQALKFAEQTLLERGEAVPERATPSEEQSEMKDDPFWGDEKNADQAKKNIKFFSWLFIAMAIYQTTIIGYILGPIAAIEGTLLGTFSVWMLVGKSRIASVLILLQSLASMAFQISIRSSTPGASYSGLIIPFGVIWAAICANYATFRYAKFLRNDSAST